LLLAVIASAFSLLYFREANSCSNIIEPGVCIGNPGGRGFPFAIPVEANFDVRESELHYLRPLIFALNFSIYFIIFGSVYFTYSKLFKKAKKK
jgi:hypothetical protein